MSADAAPAPILRMRGITKTFPGVKALQDVNLAVRRGEIHAICGENGAGKSTLMKVLSGVYPHGTYEGEITFDGEPCAFAGIRDSEHRGIVIIHQELALAAAVHRREHLPRQRAGQARADRLEPHQPRGRAAAAPGRPAARTRSPRSLDLGVGKQQLVEIAKALSKKVRLLILDEPTAALNDEDSAHLLGLLRGLRDEGITCVIISHKLNEVMAIADRVTILRDGTDDRDAATAADELTEDQIIPGWSAATSTTASRRTRRHIGEEVLRIEDWTVHSPTQPGRVVVDEANLMPAPRRDRRAGRADGRRPHRARDERLRPLLRRRHLRPHRQGRQGDQAAHGARRDRARHRVRDRGPQAVRPQPDRGHQAQHLRRRAVASSRSAAGSDENEEYKVAERVPAEHEHQGAQRR